MASNPLIIMVDLKNIVALTHLNPLAGKCVRNTVKVLGKLDMVVPGNFYILFHHGHFKWDCWQFLGISEVISMNRSRRDLLP